MKAQSFTFPQNGLISFNDNGYLCYGVFLGISQAGRVMFYSPDCAIPHVQIKIEEKSEYDCHLLPYDYLELRKKPRKWWKGFVIEVAGERYVVTEARCSFPRYKKFLIYYRDHTRLERGILFEDPRLKFVGHE